MKLLQLTTQGFRGVPDRQFSFACPDTGAPLDLVLVTGGPASGKTGLLDAIIAAKEDVGAYGTRPSETACVRSGAGTAMLEAVWWLAPHERAPAGVNEATVTTLSIFGEGAPAGDRPASLGAFFRDYSRDPQQGKVELFHAERALPAQRGAQHATHELLATDEARLRLAADNEKHRALRPHLVNALLGEALALAGALRENGVALRAGVEGPDAQFREMLRPFLYDRVLDGIEPEGDGYRIRFRGRDGTVVDLDELSAGEKQGVLFALTFHRLGLNHSIVLIDEPELHQHPRQQAGFLAQVERLGQDNQIIAATASPVLLGAVAPAQVIQLSAGG
jgi:hypothetical protein